MTRVRLMKAMLAALLFVLSTTTTHAVPAWHEPCSKVTSTAETIMDARLSGIPLPSMIEFNSDHAKAVGMGPHLLAFINDVTFFVYNLDRSNLIGANRTDTLSTLYYECITTLRG